jgi:hypothetical protein
LSIDQLASGLDLTPQEGVPDRLLGKQVHPASEEKLELVREVQEPIRVNAGRETVYHGDDEIEIARRTEFARGSRAEDVEPIHAETPAKLCKSRSVPLDELRH